MSAIKSFSKVFLLTMLFAFLASSCASTCKGGGWYGKDRNLGDKNKAIKYKKK